MLSAEVSVQIQQCMWTLSHWFLIRLAGTVLSCRELSPGSLVFTLPLPVICRLGDAVTFIRSSNHRFLGSLMIHCSSLTESNEIKWHNIGKELGVWARAYLTLQKQHSQQTGKMRFRKRQIWERKVRRRIGVKAGLASEGIQCSLRATAVFLAIEEKGVQAIIHQLS